MASLHFKYGAMGATKTRELLAVAFNYEIDNGMKVLLVLPSKANRDGEGIIKSRDGGERKADVVLHPDDSILSIFLSLQSKPDIILVDEAQFLNKLQVQELGKIVDEFSIPVLAYGLLVDSRNEMFEGSYWLMIEAEKREEIKTICAFCKKKAFKALMIDKETMKPIYNGEQVAPKATYISTCRKHYYNPIYQEIPNILDRKRK